MRVVALQEICRPYGVELCLGIKDPTLSVSVVAPPTTASITVMCKGDTLIAPWTIFHIDYGKSTGVHTTAEWFDYPCCEEEDAPRERAPQGEEEE